MKINAEERRLVIALARGTVVPTNGMQRHFLRVVAGSARPLNAHESEWLRIWGEHQRNVVMPPKPSPGQPVNSGIGELGRGESISERRECIDCGKPIPAARLAVQSSAIRCVPCQDVVDKTRGPTRRINEGIGGTRRANEIERGRVFGEVSGRSRGK